MRHLTLEHIGRLVKAEPHLEPSRRPKPMPGRKWPTHVAWCILTADRKLVGTTPATFRYKMTNYKLHTYVGKPNTYRALQARKLLTRNTNPRVVINWWQAEFDRAGLVAYKIRDEAGKTRGLSCNAYYAYHPHSPQTEIVEAFAKPLYLKYVGGMRLYSQKKRLPQEAIDAYYEWFHAQFKRRLKRPKAVPMEVSTAGPETPPEGPL